MNEATISIEDYDQLKADSRELVKAKQDILDLANDQGAVIVLNVMLSDSEIHNVYGQVRTGEYIQHSEIMSEIEMATNHSAYWCKRVVEIAKQKALASHQPHAAQWDEVNNMSLFQLIKWKLSK